MEMDLGGFAGYVSNNVLPQVRDRRSQNHGRFAARAGATTYSPASVDPLQASGGFNSVVELAAGGCRQQVNRVIRPAPFDRSISESALTTLLKDAQPGGRLALLPAATALLTTQAYRAFRLNLALAGLTFADEETVTLNFSVSLSFVFEAVQLPGVPVETVNQFWDPAWVMRSVGAAAVPAFAPGRVAPLMSRHPDRTAPIAAGLPHKGGPHFELPPENPPVPDEQDLQGIFIASFSAQLHAPLIHRDEASRCTTRVFADLRRATWTESLPPRPAAGQPSNDALLVYDSCFSNWIREALWLLHAPLDLPLSPTLSLVGSNPSGVAVPEVTDFAVRAFAVFDSSGFEPALAVAFDVVPGCHGIIEDVRHFIGPNPYGVVSDEFVVDSVFRHHWNRGGFDRRVELQAPIQVTVARNGNQQLEDAVAFGHQDLLTLDHAAITTDSNMRTDCIVFGGQAQAVATSVRLVADGQTFDASQVDLGPAQPIRWGVNGIVEPTSALAGDTAIRNFQIAALRDGGQPISEPFAFVTSPSSPALTYARIEGVSKYVLFLGNLPAALD